jgi:hypothetical protein
VFIKYKKNIIRQIRVFTSNLRYIIRVTVVTFNKSVKRESVNLYIYSTLNTLPDRALQSRLRKKLKVIVEENFAILDTTKSSTCASKLKIEVSVEILKQAKS